MFLCKKCIKREKLTFYDKLLMSKSFGKCEMCGVKTICYDWKKYKTWFK